MKIIIEIDTNKESYSEYKNQVNKAKALIDAVDVRNKVKSLYDEVFRPIIKYGDNFEEVTLYSEVWEKVYKHFEELNIDEEIF